MATQPQTQAIPQQPQLSLQPASRLALSRAAASQLNRAQRRAALRSLPPALKAIRKQLQTALVSRDRSAR